MKRGLWPVHAVLTGAALLTALVASAGPKEEACDKNYQRGLKAAGQGDWGAANKLFEQVAHDCPGFGAFFALARSEMQLKPAHLLAARLHFKEALAAAQEPGERSLAVDALASVEGQLGKLRLAGTPTGVVVIIDGRTSSPEEGVFFVEPGAHQLTIETEKCPPQREIVDAVAGAERQIQVQPCEKAVPPDAGPPDASSPSPPDAGPLAVPSVGLPAAGLRDASPGASGAGPLPQARTGPSLLGPLVVGVGGLAVSAAGGVLWQQAYSRYDAAIQLCPGNRCPDEPALQKVNGTRRDILLGQVVFGAGAAVLIGAGAWWWLLPRDKPRASMYVAPSLGPAGWGLSLGGML
ncbi:MAG: hypothetical protein MUF64_06090 [Polyangiaceae bacterium]|jgi:hypothetical protein|nr:hypothetical protein [Polyangiaceae bacterium]